MLLPLGCSNPNGVRITLTNFSHKGRFYFLPKPGLGWSGSARAGGYTEMKILFKLWEFAAMLPLAHSMVNPKIFEIF